MASESNTSAIVMCDAAVDACDAGGTDPNATMVFYSGTPPANADASLSGNTVLAQLEMSIPAFGGAVDVNPGARATANPISDDNAADATGTATFTRILNRNNVPTLQLSVGTSAAEVIVPTTSFVQGVIVQVTSCTITMPEA